MTDESKVELQSGDLVIHGFIPQGECDWSGKSGESVEISSGDGSIFHATISIPQLNNLLRFRHRQGDKHHANGSLERNGSIVRAGASQ